jgi:UDP-N-acetylglucosamine:LPS N-acetylglucosamine transferase
MTAKQPRVLAVASGGGHWVQLSRLVPAWDDCVVTYVTTDPGFKAGVEAVAAARGQSRPGYHVVFEANRWQKMRLLRSLLQIALILQRTRPDVVITTGAAPGYFALRLGALMGCRTIWIDSVANAEELSLAGQKAGRHSGLWLTQWEHLAKPDGPECKGSVL